MLEAKAFFPTTSIAGGLFMLKRTIITTGLAGGLFCPYKGLLPAAFHALNFLSRAPIFTAGAKAPYFLLLFTCSPVNGSTNSLMLI